jgi:hypothetical protein
VAGKIFGNQHIAGTELAFGTVGNFDLGAAGHEHDVLMARRGVVVLPPPGRPLADGDVPWADIVGDFGEFVGGKFLEVGFAVVAIVDAYYHGFRLSVMLVRGALGNLVVAKPWTGTGLPRRCTPRNELHFPRSSAVARGCAHRNNGV